MDARTGELLAMVSLPTFDPERPAAAADEARFNRASLGIYEMGSVFKIFTTAMALDRGVVSLSDGYDVSAPIHVARYTFRAFHPMNRCPSVPAIFMYSSKLGTVHMVMVEGTPGDTDFPGPPGPLEPDKGPLRQERVQQ